MLLFITCFIISITAIKIRTKWSPDDKSWQENTDFVNKILESNRPFTDEEFPPTAASIGKVGGDAAQERDIREEVKNAHWKRVSDIYSKDEMRLFPEPWAKTLRQGMLGDCSFLAVLGAIEARKGGVEDLFVTKEIN